MKYKNVLVNRILILFFVILLIGFISSADFDSDSVTSYVESVGGEIEGDIVVSDFGELESGTMQFAGEKAEIGEFVNGDLKKNDVVVSNVGIEKNKGMTVVTFNKEGGSFEIKGNKFENIKSQEEVGRPCFIKLDENGSISRADFETTDEGGIYVFEGTEIYVPANSRVTYNKGDGIRLEVALGEKLEKLPQLKEGYEGEAQVVRISGTYLEMFDGLVLNFGTIRWENGELFTDAWDGHVVLNDIFITGSDLMISASKKECDNCIFFDFENKNLIINTDKDYIISFLQDNDFVDIEEGDLFDIHTYDGTKLIIQNRDKESKYPLVEIGGMSKISNGDKIYEFNSNGELFVNQGVHYSTGEDSSKYYTPSSVEFYFSNLRVADENSKYITVDNSGSVFLSSYDKSPVNYNKVSEKYVENLVGKEFSFEDGVYEGSKNYILEGISKYWKSFSMFADAEIKKDVKSDLEKYKDVSVKFVTDKTFEKYFGFKNWFKSDELNFVDYGADRILLSPKEVVIRTDSVVRNDNIAYYLAVYGYISEDEYAKFGEKKFDYEYVEKVQKKLNEGKSNSNKIEGMEGILIE